MEMNKNNISILRRNPLVSFFILSYLISWILWIPLFYGHFKFGWTSWEEGMWAPRTFLGYLGALGPAISAIIMTYLIHSKNEVKTLLKRVLQWRVNILWWLIGFLLWWLICAFISIIYNLTSLQNLSLEFILVLVNFPVTILIINFPGLIGIFGEELGWRGFALPKLLDKFNPIFSSLILAIPHLFWHAPLALFVEWRSNMPIYEFVVNYFLLIIPLTLIITWFYQNTKGSILLVIVFHSAFNLTFNGFSSIFGFDKETSILLMNKSIIVLWIIAGALVIYYLYKMKFNLDYVSPKS